MTVRYTDLDKAALEFNKHVHDKGFYDQERTAGDTMMLVVSEMAEALEEFRNGHDLDEIYFIVKQTFTALGVFDEAVFEFVEGQKVDIATYEALVNDDSTRIALLKPMGVPTEFADAVIRILETGVSWGFSITEAVFIKQRYNQTRPYQHGKVRPL